MLVLDEVLRPSMHGHSTYYTHTTADHHLPDGVGRAPRSEAETQQVNAEELLREEQQSPAVQASDAYAAQLEARHRQ